MQLPHIAEQAYKDIQGNIEKDDQEERASADERTSTALRITSELAAIMQAKNQAAGITDDSDDKIPF